MATSLAAALVASKAVTAAGDDPLPLAYFLQTGAVLPTSRGKGKLLKAVNTKRTVAQVLRLAEDDLPDLIDGSERFVMELTCPTHGFTRANFAERENRARSIVEAYRRVRRSEAATLVDAWLQNVKAGFEASDAERVQLAETCDTECLAVVDAKVIVRRDTGGRPRILFHLGEVLLKADAGFVLAISDPAHRARQVASLLEASRDLREKWDATAPRVSLSF
jgi:hypothetical protein